jgi:hypothetical protein
VEGWQGNTPMGRGRKGITAVDKVLLVFALKVKRGFQIDLHPCLHAIVRYGRMGRALVPSDSLKVQRSPPGR